jgi:hypothetical protein
VAGAATRVARELAHATLLAPLFTALTGRPPSGTQAAQLGGLLDLLQRDRDFKEAATSLLDGSARWASLWPDVLARLPAQGHHHLALLDLRLGWDALDSDPAAATRSFLSALGHFKVVCGDLDYQRQFAHACGRAEGIDAAQLAGWILEPHVAALLEAVAEPASFDARRAAPHWTVLERAGTRLGGQAAALTRTSMARVVEAALAQAVEAAGQVEPLSASDVEMTAPITVLRDLTAGIGMQEELSIWGLERAVEWAWPLYKTRALDRLGALMSAVRPFGMHVEEMLLRSDGAFGRQSLCADFLLFLADNAPFEEQEGLFRRGLAVCPGHRNSRLMLSYHKLREAHAVLVKAEAPPGLSEMMLGRRAFGETVTAARALVDEAEVLFAPNPKIPDYQRRVEKLEARR